VSIVRGEPMMQAAELDQASLFVGNGAEAPSQDDLQRGLRFAHVMMSINQHEGREGVVFARALAELLVGKGVVGQEELETMMAQVGQRVEALPAPKVKLAKSADKYSFEGSVTIDCASRVHLCQATCCTW